MNMSKLQKRIIYFGTNGCVGHYPLGINFTLSKEEYNDVLVRNDIDEEWTINLFSHYDEKDKAFPFICINDFYRYCIPYEGNEYLVGKTVNIKKI